MRRPFGGKVIVPLLLSMVLLLSFGLRVWGSGFGLPEYTRYHPDEHALVERAAAILWTGDWNLHRFNYPPLYAYLQAGAYATYFLWGAAKGQWNQILPFALPQYYHVGRLLTALMATGTVLVVYLVGRRLWGRWTGLWAAILLGGCYLHVIHAHYATFDIMVAFLASLTLLFSELLRAEQRARWYLLAGLFAGLAGATKYNGAVAIAIPLVAHVLVTPWGEWGWLNGRLILLLAGFFLGFFGGNPFALASLPEFLNGLAVVLNHYGTEQPGFEGSGRDAWTWYFRALLTSADALWTIIGTLGLFGLLWREWRKGLVVIAFPLIYYLMISRFIVRFERNLVPLLPFLALGGGWLLSAAGNWLASLLRWRKGWAHLATACGALFVLALPLAASISFDAAISGTDRREVAGNWVDQHIEPGAKIAIEHYSIPFDHSKYSVEDVIRISDHDLAWYREQGFDVLIISDGVWGLLRKQPDRYADKLAVYDQLVANSMLLAEFIPEPPTVAVTGYPTVGVYHFAPVYIYRLIQ